MHINIIRRTIYLTLAITTLLCLTQTQKAFAGQVTNFIGNSNVINANSSSTSPALIGNSLGVNALYDSKGNTYLVATYGNRINKVDKFGNMNTINSGEIGDVNGNIATAKFRMIFPLYVDKNDNVYIYDAGNYKIKKIDTNGNVTTVMGTGTSGTGGVGGPATSASLILVSGFTIDETNGTMYIYDQYRIIKIVNGIVYSVAGTGISGYSGDGGPATNAQISEPGAGFGGSLNFYNGELYFVNTNNASNGAKAIRKIDSNNIISTVANGTFQTTTSGSGSSLYNAGLGKSNNFNIYFAFDNSNNMYISEGTIIRKVNMTTNIITDYMGSSAEEKIIDGTQSSARMTTISGLKYKNNKLYFIDSPSFTEIASAGGENNIRTRELDLNTNQVKTKTDYELPIKTDTPSGNFSFNFSMGGLLKYQNNNIYFTKASLYNNSIGLGIYKANTQTNMISLVAGFGSSVAEGANALSTKISQPIFDVDSNGRICYVEGSPSTPNSIRCISSSGTVNTILFSSSYSAPFKDLAFDSNNNLIILSSNGGMGSGYEILKYDINSSVSSLSSSASSGLAMTNLTVDKTNNDIYMGYTWSGNDAKIYKLNGATPQIIAGEGSSYANNIPAVDSDIKGLYKLFAVNNNVYISTNENNLSNSQTVIRKIENGVISTILGGGSYNKATVTTGSSTTDIPLNLDEPINATDFFTGYNLGLDFTIKPNGTIFFSTLFSSGIKKISNDSVYSTKKPSVTGQFSQSNTLTASNGDWNTGNSFTYQWNECNKYGRECMPIPAATSSTYNLTASDIGKYLNVAVTNNGITNHSEVTPKILKTPPQTTLTGPSGTTNNSSPSWSFTSEAGATFECKLDSGTWAACSSPKAYTNLSEGSHTFNVRAINTDEQVGPEETKTITVDTTPPAVTIDSGPSGTIADNSPSWSFSSETGATFECKMNSGVWAACSSPKSYTGLSDSTHTFSVRATDTTGNTSSPVTRTITVDTTGPTVTLTSPLTPTNNNSPSWSFTSEAGATFECHIDSEAWSACASPKTYSSLSDGNHMFYVRATDTLGNVGAIKTSTVKIDTVPPTASFTSGPSGSTNSTSPSWSFTSSEPVGATYQCSLDSAAWTSCSSPRSFTNLSEGTHTFSIKTVDSAGNTSDPVTKTITVDTAPPTVTLTGPSGTQTVKDLQWSFTSEAGAAFECKMDAGTWSACTSPKAYVGLADGSHTFSVRAADAAGNVSAEESKTVLVDTGAPTITLTGPEGKTKNTSLSWSFTSSETGTTFECKLNSDPWATCTSPKAYTGLTEGTYTLSVRGTDAANNISETVSKTATVDTTSPTVSITGGPSGLTNSKAPVWSFSSNEQGTFECKLDTGSWSACASPKAYSNLSDGPHTFNVRTTDEAGNVSNAETRTITVDTSIPTIAVTGPSGDTKDNSLTWSWTSNDPTATFECRMDDQPWEICTSPKTYSNLVDGSHTLLVRASDTANNAAIGTKTVLVDTVAPTVNLTGPEGLTKNNTATWFYSANEPGATLSCSLDGGTWTKCSSSSYFFNLAEGKHVFSVKAVDVAGNESAATSKTITVDRSKPVVTVDGPSGDFGSRNPAWSFTSSKPGGKFMCKMDTGAWEDCVSPKEYKDLTVASHTFNVKAIDIIGNESDVVVRTIKITNVTDPNTNTVLKPENISLSLADGALKVSLPAAPAGHSFQCRVDSGQWVDCNSIDVSSLAAGNHALIVRQLNEKGETVGSVQKSFTVAALCFNSSSVKVAKGYKMILSESSGNVVFSVKGKKKIKKTSVIINGKSFSGKGGKTVVKSSVIDAALRSSASLKISIKTDKAKHSVSFKKVSCDLKPVVKKSVKVKGKKGSLVVDFAKNTITLNKKNVVVRVNDIKVSSGKLSVKAVRSLQLNPKSSVFVKKVKKPFTIKIV